MGSLPLEPPGKPDLEYKNIFFFFLKREKNTYTRFGVEVNIYFEREWEEVHTLEGVFSLTFIYLK